ncbi:uncharacterized protein LOC133186045 [Saccostrea echinata]|uniref:uncharacterized protein LOC133186045 n=1 Tax=Saccostrea echinata TaxID=191078 RepID=UPI002A7EF385|nr:uncharacterized protein LOC133186045 [Saccostrea echinata]
MDNPVNNNSQSPTTDSSDKMVLNNLLAREILKRQALETKVATLERQIQALVSDVAASKTKYTALEHTVQKNSLRQTNMATSLQTITKRVDSEYINIRQSLDHLSGIINDNRDRVSPSPVAFLARVTSTTPSHSGPIVSFQMEDLNLGNAYSSASGIFKAPVTGVYNFQTTIHIQRDRFEGYISLNGIPQTYLTLTGSDHEAFGSVSVTLRINNGDRVWFERTDKSNSVIISRKSLFSGFLVQAY